MIKLCVAVSAVLLSPLVFSQEAAAATTLKYYYNQAVASCQAALPAFDGLIRKRPKALVNEGTTTAFVTCAPGHQSDWLQTVQKFSVVLVNRQTVSVDLTCTLVDGLADTTYSAYNVKTITLAPGARNNVVWAYVADNDSGRYSVPAVSCALPPATEISGIAVEALDEIGS